MKVPTSWNCFESYIRLHSFGFRFHTYVLSVGQSGYWTFLCLSVLAYNTRMIIVGPTLLVYWEDKKINTKYYTQETSLAVARWETFVHGCKMPRMAGDTQEVVVTYLLGILVLWLPSPGKPHHDHSTQSLFLQKLLSILCTKSKPTMVKPSLWTCN